MDKVHRAVIYREHDGKTWTVVLLDKNESQLDAKRFNNATEAEDYAVNSDCLYTDRPTPRVSKKGMKFFS